MIGRHATAQQFFAGAVHDVRVYERVLNDTEIAALSSPDPSPPGDTRLSAFADGQAVQLTWSAAIDPESGISGYRIYRDVTSGTTKTLLTVVDGATVTYRDAATAPNTRYYYEVAAINGAGLEGIRSNEANALTGNEPPAPPVGLIAQSANERVDLDWANNTELDLAGYHVYRSTTPGGSYIRLTAAPVTTSGYIDQGLSNGTTYYYVVTATDTGGVESISSAEVSATPIAVDPAVVGYWPFDEGEGTIAQDISGNNHTGTLVNGPLWTTGLMGAGLTFDGVDDYVSTNYSINLSTWTIAVWVRSPSAPAALPAAGPIHREANFQMNWNHTSGAYRGSAALRVGGRWYGASFGALSGNTWYHLAATYDGETLRAYRNGSLVTSNTNPSGPPDSETAPLVFGRHAGSVTQYFAGTIDDSRVYGRALNDAEIAALASVISP
jgi:hypothetical protein